MFKTKKKIKNAKTNKITNIEIEKTISK